MSEISENTIIHFILGQCTEDELIQVYEWMAKDQQNADLLFEMERIYQQLQCDAMSQSQIEASLKHVHRVCSAPLTSASSTRLRTWMRYAAIILITVLAGAGSLWYIHGFKSATQYMTASTDGKTTKQIQLPDGSRVWLNHNSSLTYPVTFDDNIRRVSLKGEGYFEVEKDKAKPFVVENRAMTVTVLGTVFDFKNDTKNMYSEVSLIEGSVEVKSNRSAGQMVLQPGQKAKLDYHTGHVTVTNIYNETDIAWHTLLIPFRNATIAEIAKQLEKLYNVNIEISPQVNLKNTYSGSIKYKRDIDSVFNSLQNTLPITFQKRGRQAYIIKDM